MLRLGTPGGTLSVQSGTTQLTGNLTVAAGATLTKLGAGRLQITGPQNWGSGAVLQIGSASGSGTPEPATSAFLAAGGMAVLFCWCWRRRKSWLRRLS
jgi:hypothetical protein